MDTFFSFYVLPALLILLKSVVLIVVLLVFVAYILYADRKIWAAVQLRRGPNVVGPWGTLQAFADLLKKATPSVDTAIPLTPAQIADHVAALIDAGRAEEALDIIAKRQAARDESVTPGTDVQLRYQQGRALAALGRHDEAMTVWRQMTTDYPELPEPWNALAIEYARRGQLQLARDALDMALVSDPSFAPALENLGHVQMRLARESFDRARAAGASPAPAAAPAGQPAHDKTAAPKAQ